MRYGTATSTGSDRDGTHCRGSADGGRRRQKAETTTQEAKTMVTDSWVTSTSRRP